MLTQDHQAAIAKAWRDRATMQGYGKPSSAKYRKAEIDFVAGVASVLNVLHPNPEAGLLSSMVPRSWVLNPVLGRNVFPLEDPRPPAPASPTAAAMATLKARTASATSCRRASN